MSSTTAVVVITATYLLTFIAVNFTSRLLHQSIKNNKLFKNSVALQHTKTNDSNTETRAHAYTHRRQRRTVTTAEIWLLAKFPKIILNTLVTVNNDYCRIPLAADDVK